MAKKNRKPSRLVYSVHPMIAYSLAVVNNLPKTTGKSIDEWMRLVKKAGPSGEKPCYEWLKKQHKLGGTTAWMIANRAFGKADAQNDPNIYLKCAPQRVEAMYAGAKSALRPIHDALVELGRSVGDDVKVCPCETIVPLYRNHVFAQIKPSTLTRIDFGLALKGAKRKPPKRLIDTGGLQKNDRITHRFAITSIAEIDDEVKRWLRVAYDLDS